MSQYVGPAYPSSGTVIEGQYIDSAVSVSGSITLGNVTIRQSGSLSVMGNLYLNGINNNSGKIQFTPNGHGGDSTVNLGIDSTSPNAIPVLSNFGSILALTPLMRVTFTSAISGAIINNYGDINIGTTRFGVPVTGTGLIRFSQINLLQGVVAASAEFDQAVGSGQTIDMTNYATITLLDPAEFRASLVNFSQSNYAIPSYNQSVQDTIDMKGKSVTEVKYSGDEGKGVLSLVSESAIICSVNFTGNYVHARFSITYSGSDSLIRLIDFNGPANGTYPETQQLNPTPPSSGGVTNNTTISNTTVKNTTINNTTVNNTTNINVISAVNANPSLRFIDTTIDAQAARLYQAAFDRAPDSAGLAYWANALAQGSSLLAIAGGFVASAEFQGRYSVSDRGGLVAGFYRNVLGREPDAAGTAYWKAALDNGSATPEQVLCGFSESIENKCHVPDAQTASVARLYYAELGRAPDAAGLSFWTSGLAVGTASLQDEASALASSPEFIGRYGALDDAGFVNQLYRNVLGRDGDAQGVAAWTANLAGAAPRGSVVIGFSESQEFKDKFVTTIAENGIQLS